jgi:FkbM family methyltransferase
LALASNRLRNVVTVPVGLSDGAGIQTLSVPLKRRGSHGFGLSHLGPNDGGRAVVRDLVATVTLDDLAREMALCRLDFMKADVEGWEMRVVAGGHETIQRHRPAMLLELNEGHLARAGDDLTSAWTTLEGLGYRPFRARGFSLEPITGPAAGDVFCLPEESCAELLHATE